MSERVRTASSAWLGLLVTGLAALLATSCTSPQSPVPPRDTNNESAWPRGQQTWKVTTVLPSDWAQRMQFWKPASYGLQQAEVPKIESADFSGVNGLCAECHSTHTRFFVDNVHQALSCEQCHGNASLHLQSRGKQTNSILSFSKQGIGVAAGKRLSSAERAEVCLQCHEQGRQGESVPCVLGPMWRTSSHAHHDVSCTDCHNAHYLVPPGTPAADEVVQQPRAPQQPVQLAMAYQDADQESRRNLSRNLGAVSPAICYDCHGDMRRLEQTPHPHQLGMTHVVNNQRVTLNCTTCHDAHGNVRTETRKDLCLQCHQDVHAREWSGSPHDVAGVACTDCHNPHPAAGLPMAVNQPETCYRCHSQMRQLEEIAHPHQIGGTNGFQCTTCHRPHGQVLASTRTDVCMDCHKGSPTMAWHSSIHHREGVACADCHNAHPETNVPKFVTISHTNVKRKPRLPMCVDEPGVCYQCHQQIYGLTSMPSHHPIKEGKMMCSACHDGHGQGAGNLKADSVNDLCYQCHADKEGPFAWEHAPVTEDCGHCHNPHGTVANHLLHQPTTFLCLRCHAGHSTHGPANQCQRCHPGFFGPGEDYDIGGGPQDPPIATTLNGPDAARRALFTDCTQCHAQVHGSDLSSGVTCGCMMRR